MTRKTKTPRDPKRDVDDPRGAHDQRGDEPLTQTSDGQWHDAQGLLVDEYSDPSIKHEPASDALDDPASLVNETVLENVADGDGVEEIDTVEAGSEVDLLEGGGRKVGGPDHRIER